MNSIPALIRRVLGNTIPKRPVFLFHLHQAYEYVFAAQAGVLAQPVRNRRIQRLLLLQSARIVARDFFAAAEVRASTDGRDLPACDFGLVATKALHTRAAVEGARAALAGAAVVSVQNGLGNEEVIAELVPRVIRGSIVTAGAIVAPGVVRYDAPGDSWFGPFEPRPAPMGEIERLAGLLCAGGLRTHALADARGPQWTKVIFNSATSPLAALTGLPMGPLCTDRALRSQVDALVTEALAVCERAGHHPAATAEEARGGSHRGGVRATSPACSRTSWRAGRPRSTCCNGGIAAEGRRAGGPTPRHDCMVALVKGLEKSWSA